MSDTPTDELDALLALDALLDEEQADAELLVGTFPSHLAAAALLAEETETVPPADLRADVLAGALAGRRPGRPVDAVPPCAPKVAFDRTVEDFRELLDSLTESEWNAPAHEDHGRVRDLVAHLVGVERLVRRWLDPEDSVPDLPNHVESTRSLVADLADVDPREVARQWYAAAREVSAAAGDGDRMVTFHDLTMTVDQLLVTRTSELWAHGMDIGQASGRPLLALDDERMALLCTMLTGALPVALAYQGRAEPGRAVRIVLSGPAGGTFVVPLAPQPSIPEPDVTIIADASRFCRVAVRRLRPDELDGAIDGDPRLADLVLTGVSGLAKD